MDKVFLLDGKAYNIEVGKDSLGRSFVVADSKQPGRIMDYTTDRDIIGAFYNYAMKVCPKMNSLASYDTFYNIVSDPSYTSHEMTFPYGQETLTFQAYVGQGKDKLRIRNRGNIWGMDGLSLDFAAMEPQRRR